MSVRQYGNDLSIPPHHIVIGSTNRLDYYYCELLVLGADLPAGLSNPATEAQVLALGGFKVASLYTDEATGSYSLIFNSGAYPGS